jgi:hypothetical protein
VGAGASRALALDDALDSGPGRAVDVDCLVFLVLLVLLVVVRRAGRDDPDGEFDMVFS